MSADLDPRDDLTDRLAAFGRQPVDPALQSQHLTAMAGVRSGSAFRTSLVGRAKVAAGVFAGFLIGATGLTTAGAMGPLQPIAAKAVEAVAPVDVPKGKSDEAKARAKAAKEAREADGSPGAPKIWGGEDCPAQGEFKNRGLFLKAAKDEDPAAGMTFADARKSDCGKAVGGADDDDVEELEAPETEGDEVEGEGKGKENAPGQAEGAERGQSAERKPDSPGKSDEAPDAGKPDSTPAASLPDQADDEATTKAPSATPGEAPADPNAESESETETENSEL